MKRKVTILGAGLVGSLLSILLRKRGYEVTIYERRGDMRVEPLAAGRSINLAMSNRGWKALDLAGLRNDIEKIAIPMYGRYLHLMDGSKALQPYGKNQEAIYSVSRGDLNKMLMDLAEKNGVEIHFNQKCQKVDVENNIIYLENNNDVTAVQCDLLLGADGAFSSLRDAYTKLDRTDYQQFYIDAGYKELQIPAGENGSFLMEKNALHIWPRGNFMMIALPNPEGNFTCTLFFPFDGEKSFNALQTEKEIELFFNQYFNDAVGMMPTLIHDFKNNPVSSLVTVKVNPWYYKNKSALIGDAAHAIVPFYGQGMNAGFEDCTVLWQLLEDYNDDWHQILPAYHNKRKKNGDAVADLALENFIEMRDKVADKKFLVRKQIEKEIGRMYPEIFNSVYEMVSFSNTPYVTAQESIGAQDRLLEKIMNEGDFFELKSDSQFKHTLDLYMKEYQDEIMLIHAS